VKGRLDYVGSDFYNFEDPTYRWIDVKRFSIDGLVEDREVVAALLEHVRYRDHYTSGDSQDIDSGTLHGPYRLDAIAPDAYEPITENQAAAAIAEFAHLYGEEPPEGVSTRIEAGLDPLVRSAEGRYRLRQLPDDARHELSWILWEFRELLLINVAKQCAALVVMAID
jgi:hypothetical protein